MGVVAEVHAPVDATALRRIFAAHPGVTVEVDAAVPTGRPYHLLWVVGGDPDAVRRTIEDDRTDAPWTALDELPDRLLLRIDRSSVDWAPFDLAETAVGRLADAEATADGWSLRLRFGGEVELRSFLQAAEAHALDVALGRLREAAPADDDQHGLSPAQREALTLAYEAGYFEIPRGTTLSELADTLGISEQGVSERLRRALRNSLRSVLQSPGERPPDG